jgi:hypothetical protein
MPENRVQSGFQSNPIATKNSLPVLFMVAVLMQVGLG